MFFPKKIASISKGDWVLEIGPGGSPHPRSNVLLERVFENEAEAAAQRGNTGKLVSDKKIVYYDGKKFPFKDNEFDYVICSHVVEHVKNIEFFMEEVFRVAPKGYLEYPTIYYEYLYNFSVHLNLVKFKNEKLFYLPKNSTALNDFMLVHKTFHRSLELGYGQIVDDLRNVMFEGFEWRKKFEVKLAVSIQDLVYEPEEIALLPVRARSSIFIKVVNKAKSLFALF